MNKTLMLVICDFLLLSMLALARFDAPTPIESPTLDASTASAEAEIIALLEASLQSELNSRENLSENLSQTRAALQVKALQLAEREASLANTQSELSEKAAEADTLIKQKAAMLAQQQKSADKTAKLVTESAQLAKRVETTRQKLDDANQKRFELSSTLGQIQQASSLTQERLNQSERLLLQGERNLAAREIELAQAEAAKDALALKSERLSQQLEIALAERKLLQESLQQQRLDKQQAYARAEQLGKNVTRLGEGFSQLGQGVAQIGQNVDSLAQSSAEIQQEILDSRTQTMSEIFTRFQKNRAELNFSSLEKALFGGAKSQNYSSKSILIEDSKGEYFLVTHTNDTPFDLGKIASNLLAVELELKLGSLSIPITQISFLSSDPRLIFIPLPQDLVKNTDWETFPLAQTPQRWEEAILVKNDESNFGRSAFKRLTQSNRFLKMERPALGQLFSDFATTTGDLAFTQNGRFIGVLSNKNHTVVIENFPALASIQIGHAFIPTNYLQTINRLKTAVLQLPREVQ
jgi:hypothetical protein